MSKAISSRLLWLSLLGALNGALYSAVTFLLVRWLHELADKRNLAESESSGDYINLVSFERWNSIIILWVIMFTLVTLAVGSLWRKRDIGSVLFWVSIGAVAAAAWNGFALLGFLLDEVYASHPINYRWEAWLRNPLYGPTSLTVAILVNLVYGYAVRSLFRMSSGSVFNRK